MLDIKFIRENKDLIKDAARKKHIKFDVDRLLTVDDARRKLIQTTEELRSKQNIESDRVVKIENEEEKKNLIEDLRSLKNRFLNAESELKRVTKEWNKLMLEVPNIPDPSVPDGKDDEDNQEIRKWGEKPKFSFSIQNHVDLMKNLDLVDFERGTKVSGFRGYFLKNEAAQLSMILWQWAIEEWIKKGFELFLVPSMAREINLFGTGHLPHGQEDVYKTQDNLYLSATAEIPFTGYYADEILEEKDLPKKYVGFSPCFRREAGSHGKDTKGLYRVHEFFKVEQFILCRADHQESVKWHEEMTQNSEGILQKLGLPYRVVVNCGGDIGRAHVKTYDIEVWIPTDKKYRESHSSSYYHDFQARRLNIRYRDKNGKIYIAHTLNNTVIATPRILISLLENNQQEDGSILIPEVLQKYLGKDKISKNSSINSLQDDS
ncbi:serine--tRNA ligase [Patescibacteria group bacterium]